MSKITEAANYRGVVVEHAVGATKEKGLPQFVAKFRALERYDIEEKVWVGWEAREDNEITGYLVMFSQKGDPIFHVKNIQEVFEWDGVSLVGLETLDLEGAEVQFEVVENTYEGGTSMKVANIRGYNDEPGSSVRKLDSAELAKMNAKYGNALKKLSGGPKAASAKTKAKAAPAPPAAPTEAEAVAEATKPVPELPVEEAIEEFNKKPAAPPAPPAPPVAPNVTDADFTYETAWVECNAKKNKHVDDKTVAASFSAAMHRQAPGKSETEISGADWALIVESVTGECG